MLQIEVDMDIQRYGAKITTPKLPHPFPELKWKAKKRKEKEEERDEAWKKAWSNVSRKFSKAEERKDVEEMHRLWCKAAVHMLKIVTDTEGLMKFKQAEKRTYTANMSSKKGQGPANQEGNPTTNRCRRMVKLAARLRELQNQLLTNDKYIVEGRQVSGEAERQRQQLW